MLAGREATAVALDKAKAKSNAEAQLNALLPELQKIELSHSEVIFEKLIEGNAQVVAVKFEPPTQSEVVEIFNSLQRYVDFGPSEERPFREKLAKEAQTEFTYFPRPIRIVLASINLDRAGWVAEGFFNDVASATPNEKGLLLFPPEAELRMDEDWDHSKWAKRRFGYLLKVGHSSDQR